MLRCHAELSSSLIELACWMATRLLLHISTLPVSCRWRNVSESVCVIGNFVDDDVYFYSLIHIRITTINKTIQTTLSSSFTWYFGDRCVLDIIKED
jgi:hypothetical protein